MDAEDKKSREFMRRFWGYNTLEVDGFVALATDQLSSLRRENENLRQELAELKGELKDFRGRETNLEATITQTREVAEEIKSNAERESQLLIAEAELQAEKILGQTHNRLAQIHDDISELKRQRVQFEVRLRSLVEAHLKLLDVESDRDREMADLEDKIKILRTTTS